MLIVMVNIVVILSPYRRAHLLISASLPQDSVNKAVLSFKKRLNKCIKVSRGHLEH